MIKKILVIGFLSFLFNATKAQKQVKSDTIYVICQQEMINFKYHFLSPQKDSFYTVFSFKSNWEIHGHKREFIEFEFNSKPMHMEPSNNFFVKMIDTNTIKLYRNLYTLEQFTKALKNDNFSLPIANGKVHIIMLYGAACLSKVEVYPVKISTDLSSEG